MNQTRHIRLFVAATRDVADERKFLYQIADRINLELVAGGRFRLEIVRWEAAFYGAHTSFQMPLPEAKDCDIVIGIVWWRMGTALPEGFAILDPAYQDLSEGYPSSTAYEIISSLIARDRSERRAPDVRVFFKSEPPKVAIESPDFVDIREQAQKSDTFRKSWFSPGRPFEADAHAFQTPQEFAKLAEAYIRDWLRKEHISLSGKSRIFVSYRRADTRHVAGRIWDRLVDEFGTECVFFDQSSIPGAVDFRNHIEHSLRQCAVVLMVVGKNWQNMPSHFGLRWLRRNSEDYVHLELELALNMNIPIVPICIDEASMPEPRSLPVALRSVSFLQACALRTGKDFQRDMDAIITTIQDLWIQG